ncbi:MAG: CGNR zinc finger domain-containing protein [Rhodanobacter sp.]
MKNLLQVTVESHVFSARDFVAGDSAIDFVNTVTGRDQSPRDWLDSYARLLDWVVMAKLLPPGVLRQLRTKATADPNAAAAALKRAKVLREQLFSLLAAVISGRTPSRNSLASLRESWIAGVSAHQLQFHCGRLVKGICNDADLGLIESVVAFRIVECVLASPTDRLRICQGPDCSWLFIDSSKGGRRRWCDMAVCGNAAKSRRFNARSRDRRDVSRQ